MEQRAPYICVKWDKDAERYRFLENALPHVDDAAICRTTFDINGAVRLQYAEAYAYCRQQADRRKGNVGLIPCHCGIFTSIVADYMPISPLVLMAEFMFYVKYANLIYVGGAYFYEPKHAPSGVTMRLLPVRFWRFLHPDEESDGESAVLRIHHDEMPDTITTVLAQPEAVEKDWPLIHEISWALQGFGAFLTNEYAWKE